MKLGKIYITKNNPRELLKEIAEKQNIIDKAIEYINENYDVEPKELYGLIDGDGLLNILQKEEK